MNFATNESARLKLLVKCSLLILGYYQVGWAQKTSDPTTEIFHEQHAPIAEFEITAEDKVVYCDDPRIIQPLVDFKFPHFREDFPTFDLEDRSKRLEKILGSTDGFSPAEITRYRKKNTENAKLRFQIDRYIDAVIKEFDQKRHDYNVLNERAIKTEQNLRRSRRRFNPADRLNLDELNKKESETRRERDALAKRITVLKDCLMRPVTKTYSFDSRPDPAT